MKTRMALISAACLALVVSQCGCNKNDADVLASIGRRLAEKAHVGSDGAESMWTKVSGRLGLELRVKNRLRWDKSLADLAIEVRATDTAVELKGTVLTSEQIRRAGELAESTVGVDRVVNSLILAAE